MEGIAFLEGTEIVDANEQFAILFGWKELPIGEDILNMVNARDWQRWGSGSLRGRVWSFKASPSKGRRFTWRPRDRRTPRPTKPC